MSDIEGTSNHVSPVSVSLADDIVVNPLEMAASAPQAQAAKRPKLLAPQDAIDDFWSKFTSKKPGKATTVIPQNQYADRIARRNPQQCPSAATRASYDDAAAMCRAKVEKIAKECRRINKKYRDPHFDLESDLKLGLRDCLQSLSNLDIKDAKPPGSDFKPQSAKRVVDIFDKPRIYIDGPTANDVRQGRDGDCWLMAALCTLSNKKGLIEKLCVAHDQDVGVYGFVFHRDGEWMSEIVDDFLYLTKPDYDESYLDRVLFDDLERTNPEEVYRRIYQSNSSALYFAQCQHPQETWLPLLEKCFAKAHGDYAAIEGGFGGEGIEDLTGGVASELFTTDVLDKEHFWGELLKVNQDFLFSCSAGIWGSGRGDTGGILDRHSYSIQKAVEIEGKRLLRLKNPWGKVEWNGPWSDGSEEWTPEWLEMLDHKFGDDGDFWIAFEDLLRKFQAFDRTRLFGPEWQLAQIWTAFAVPWTLDYQDTHFAFSIARPGPVVIVLSQLDDRYFRGLEGQYCFELAFRVHKAGREDYLVRSQTPYRMRRSVNVELDLDQGEYEVLVKISATRYEQLLPIDQVIRNNVKERRDKLIRVGLAYDLAHGKGRFVETPEEQAARETRQRREDDRKRQEAKEKILSGREDTHYLKAKKIQRDQRKLDKRRAGPKKRQENETSLLPPDTSSHGPPKADEEAIARQLKEAHFSESPDEMSNGTGSFPPISKRRGGDQANGHGSRNDDDLESLETLSDLSDRELNMQVDAILNHPGGTTKEETPAASPEEPDEFEKDPWNAVVVVGLRVYHKASEEGSSEDIVKLKVVRPSLLVTNPEDQEQQSNKERKNTGLDVDDSAKDATLEGGVKERKQSILGDELRAG